MALVSFVAAFLVHGNNVVVVELEHLNIESFFYPIREKKRNGYFLYSEILLVDCN